MADDIGTEQVRFNGAEDIERLNIHGLVAAGTRLGAATACRCAPSGANLLSEQYPFRQWLGEPPRSTSVSKRNSFQLEVRVFVRPRIAEGKSYNHYDQQ